jgi:hypothetical protein
MAAGSAGNSDSSQTQVKVSQTGLTHSGGASPLDSMTFVNLYGSNRADLRIEFFKRINKWIKQHCNEDNFIIIAGDLNCNGKNDKSFKEFIKFKCNHNLKDVWDHVNPNKICKTWIDPANPCKQSRLDYTLTSGFLINYVEKCHLDYAPVPDHKALLTIFHVNMNKRGPSYWKLNVSILDEPEYKKGVENVYECTTKECGDFLCKQKLWDFIKIRIKEFTIKYCYIRKKRRMKM